MSADTPLSPPEDDLVLTPPEPVRPVRPERARDLVPIEEAKRAELHRRADSYAAELAGLDPRSPEFLARVGDIAALGEGEMRASAESTNRLLRRSVSGMSGAKGEGADAQRRVGEGLLELRRTVEDLDPKDAGRLTGRRLLGFLPFGNAARDLVHRYQAADTSLNRIVASLRSGQDELRRDNAALHNERARLWETMGRLQEYAVLAEALDAAVQRRVDAADPDTAARLRADVLFPVRQRHQDLLTQLAVCVQGYLALDTLRRGNEELIKGVDRAATTTVSALRVAVTVAQALANQKRVVEQVDALRGTTEDIIAANAEMLATQSEDVQRIAADPAVGVETLREAFRRIYATIDKIDHFKEQAVENMAATTEALRGELEAAGTYLERSRRPGESDR
ncbi:toxic anion resistance protein [Streptomonospora sp. S1-112]|uniref:Toxic anion resistance protein n=1 Tax=Streptomonospora mangrovi TaxID=2883123 RepID=A0A9X3SPZ8_9ACTN|nr:toxic anion resistance protein [Streptomonospora mangrovi]MDA0566261.1 toxic anion resistance protein [Streptomonospora mangrovi]